MALQNYWVEYLTKTELTGGAPEPGTDGWFRNRRIVTAGNERGAVEEVIYTGGVPLKVWLVKRRNPLFNRVSREYKQEFLSAVLYNMTSGLSAGKALQATAEGETGAMRERLDMALRVVSRGGSFTESLRAVDFFDETTLAIVDSGERTGQIRQSVETAIEHYKSWAAGMKAVIGIAGVVAFDFLSAFSTVIGVRWQLLPMLEESGFKSEDQAKIDAFKEGIAQAYVVNDILFYAAIIAMLIGGVGAVIMVAGDEEPKRWIRRQFLKVPYLKDALNHSALSTSMKVAASLLKGGVHFFRAISIIRRGTTNETVDRYWATVSRRVEGGAPVSRAMIESHILDGTERVSLSAHTNQKQLGEILARISERRAEKAQKSAKKFTYMSIGVTLVYIMLSVGVAMWVMKLQNSAMMAGAS